MPFYLSEWQGAGTSSDPCVPVADGQASWAAIDLRADGGATPTGGGLNACLLRVPAAFSDARARFLADDKLETLTNQQRNFIANKLGADLGSATLLRDIIIGLLTNPPAGKWKPLLPGLLEWEIWLGELIWSAPRVSGGASDDFNRANETPVAAPWSKATGANINLASNMLTLASTADTLYFYTGSTTSADQYSQASAPDGGSDMGAACRISGTNGYIFHANAGQAKYVSGSFSAINSVTPTTAVNDVLRIEMQGSTMSTFVNGVATSPASATDTAIPGAGSGAGVWLGTSAIRADNWQGGDLTAGPARHPANFQPIPFMSNQRI